MEYIEQDTNYRVIGILQYCINGEWSERPITSPEYGVDGEHAAERVLRTANETAQQHDPHGFARWHTPELVRVYPE